MDMKRMIIGLMMMVMAVFGGCGNDKMVEIIHNDIVKTNRYSDGKALIYSIYDEIRYASYAVYLMNQYGTVAVMDSDDLYRNFLMLQNNGTFLTKNDLYSSYIFPDINRYGTVNFDEACAIATGTYYDAIDPTKDRKNAYSIFNIPTDPYDPSIWTIERYKPTKAEKNNPWFEKEIYVAKHENEFMTYEILIENDKDRHALYYNFDESRVRIKLSNGKVIDYKLNDAEYHNIVAVGYINQIATNWYKKADDITGRHASVYDLVSIIEMEFYNSNNDRHDVNSMLDEQVLDSVMGGN